MVDEGVQRWGYYLFNYVQLKMFDSYFHVTRKNILLIS